MRLFMRSLGGVVPHGDVAAELSAGHDLDYKDGKLASDFPNTCEYQG